MTTTRTALTAEEAEHFHETLRAIDARNETSRVALLRVELDGQPYAALSLIARDGEGTRIVKPMALLITDEVFARMTGPQED